LKRKERRRGKETSFWGKRKKGIYSHKDDQKKLNEKETGFKKPENTT